MTQSLSSRQRVLKQLWDAPTPFAVWVILEREASARGDDTAPELRIEADAVALFNPRTSAKSGNAPAYTVKLRPATRVLMNFDVLQLLKSGLGDALILEKIQTSSCEFKTAPEDITAVHREGVSDAIIAAMMRAVPVEQGGPTTGIQPAKK